MEIFHGPDGPPFPPPHDRHLRGISRVPRVFAFSLRLAAGAPVRLR